MKIEIATAAVSLSKMTRNQRARWYFERFWVDVAEQHGYAYPGAFPEGSALAAAHNAAHAILVADLRPMS